MGATKTKMVIVVRNDLEMTTGKIVAQTGHAIAQLIISNDRASPAYWGLFDNWVATGQKKVCLQCDEDKLLEIGIKCKLLKIPIVIIRDAGKTQVKPGTITCIAIGPVAEQSVKKITGNLRLL